MFFLPSSSPHLFVLSVCLSRSFFCLPALVFSFLVRFLVFHCPHLSCSVLLSSCALPPLSSLVPPLLSLPVLSVLSYLSQTTNFSRPSLLLSNLSLTPG